MIQTQEAKALEASIPDVPENLLLGVPIIRADYDALSTEEKNNGLLYLIVPAV